MDLDEQWMSQAIAAALEAEALGEIPVGCCVVSEGRLLAVAGNRTRTDSDPTAHAEVIALRTAAKVVGNYRLTDAVVYSTIEPCAMCAGAMVHARIQRLVYGATDPRAGAAGSIFNIVQNTALNHRVEIESGVLADDCSKLLRDFFVARR